jgi:hypothetical protein
MQCMMAMPAPSPTTAIATTDLRASAGVIDATSHLKPDNVFMFSGTQDTTVHPPVMQSLYTYYNNYIPANQIYFQSNWTAAHTQPTDDPVNSNSCTESIPPYISYCQYDGAGMALNHLYGKFHCFCLPVCLSANL